ncbi:MAG: hypothetical protein NC211_00265 [Alistipes senegalensis]|nr:hypothetical protein [Oxalobacter formigenes]MCM1280263.1 hypothetical protein [Alistipes senegalensis]
MIKASQAVSNKGCAIAIFECGGNGWTGLAAFGLRQAENCLRYFNNQRVGQVALQAIKTQPFAGCVSMEGNTDAGQVSAIPKCYKFLYSNSHRHTAEDFHQPMHLSGQ